MGRLDGKVVVVTGATTGMGAAAARALAEDGARVALAGRRRELGEGVAAEIRATCGDAYFVPADVTVEADMARLIEQTLRRYGRLDGAFNNAGGARSFGRRVEELDAHAFADDIAVNLTGTFLALKYEIPAIRQAGGGSIVNHASTAGVSGVERLAGYVAAKHGVVGLTKTAALEAGQDNIRVNALVTGPVATEKWRRGVAASPHAAERAASATALGRVADEREIANFVVFLISDAAPFITGAALAIDGGRTAG